MGRVSACALSVDGGLCGHVGISKGRKVAEVIPWPWSELEEAWVLIPKHRSITIPEHGVAITFLGSPVPHFQEHEGGNPAQLTVNGKKIKISGNRRIFNSLTVACNHPIPIGSLKIAPRNKPQSLLYNLIVFRSRVWLISHLRAQHPFILSCLPVFPTGPPYSLTQWGPTFETSLSKVGLHNCFPGPKKARLSSLLEADHQGWRLGCEETHSYGFFCGNTHTHTFFFAFF